MAPTPPLTLLVPTKLTAPQPRAFWVRRERLLAQLESALSAQITVIIAPAGFGKSTLVAQWLSELHPSSVRSTLTAGAPIRVADAHGGSPRPSAVAWLTLDEHDQDGLRFLAYVAGAIEQAAPQALATTHPLLAAPDPPPLYMVLQALLVDLSCLQGALTLVLDDYHAISSEAIHQAVAYLLRHLPPTCHVMLISRVDPPLPLARLRAEQQLTELRAAELRFTTAEAGSLLTNLLGRPPDDALVATLQAETEGWPLALQLAALARLEAPATERTLHLARLQIAEYLADEVFDQQPAPIQAALLALAVPERICAELAAALLDPPAALAQAEALISQLMHANLFLLPLDAEWRWYRFHHLFRDMLLRRLRLTAGSEGTAALQLRAARWLAAEGLFEEAMRQLLAAGAVDAAADLVESRLAVNLGRDLGAAPPGYWLRMLPDGLSARRPGLALLAARLDSFHTDVPALEASLARVDALLVAPGAAERALPWPAFPGDLATLRGSLRYWQGRPAEAIEHLRSALELGPVPPLASQALHILGKAYVAAGRYDEGVGEIYTSARAVSASLGQFDVATRYLTLCGMHATAGTTADLAAAAEGLAAAVSSRGLGDFWVCYAEAYSGRAAYERSDLAAAAGHFAAVVRRKYQINAPIYIGCLIGLAQIAAIQGDLAVATAYAHDARAFAAEAGGAFLRHQALGLAVRLALARGDLPEARAAAQGIAPDLHEGVNTWFTVEAPRLSQASVLIRDADPVSLEHADTILAAYLAEAVPLHNLQREIAALATLALLRHAQGRPAEALAILERAVAQAAPRGLVRTLVDRGPALTPLLHALADRGVHRPYLTGVLAAYGPPRDQPAHPIVAQPAPAIPEMLTPRESEILALLAERWSDKEIAARLVIAPNTVRKHTSTIFGKLGVGSRREAVAAARALGLLPAAAGPPR